MWRRSLGARPGWEERYPDWDVCSGKLLKRPLRFEKPKQHSAYRGPSVLEAVTGGSEVRPVWVPCPLPSPGDHKLARCNSLPDGLAPSRCVFVYTSANKGEGGGRGSP